MRACRSIDEPGDIEDAITAYIIRRAEALGYRYEAHLRGLN